MASSAAELAERARRTALIRAVQAISSWSLADLCALVEHSPYAAELGSISLRELRDQPPRQGERQEPQRSERWLLDAFQAIFELQPTAAFSSGYFVQHFQVRRWTAQKLLAKLVARGVIERFGVTSATRYRLANEDESALARGRERRPENGDVS